MNKDYFMFWTCPWKFCGNINVYNSGCSTTKQLAFFFNDLLNAKEFVCYQYKKVQADYKMYYTGFFDGWEKTYWLTFCASLDYL